LGHHGLARRKAFRQLLRVAQQQLVDLVRAPLPLLIREVRLLELAELGRRELLEIMPVSLFAGLVDRPVLGFPGSYPIDHSQTPNREVNPVTSRAPSRRLCGLLPDRGPPIGPAGAPDARPRVPRHPACGESTAADASRTTRAYRWVFQP